MKRKAGRGESELVCLDEEDETKERVADQETKGGWSPEKKKGNLKRKNGREKGAAAEAYDLGVCEE